MVVAMSRDIRVLVIKLADRLHNMRTLRYLPREKQERKSREVLEIFAPLAHRLGMNTIKWELEDLAFATLYPKRYDEIARLVSERAPRRDVFLQEVIEDVSADLREAKIKARVTGRPKHYYSVYQKMIARNVGFDDIYDLVGIRVLVDSVRDCYAALGTVHARWNPVPGRFKDYIAMPKFNMYQSLHTTVIGPGGKPVELQIRTWGMHRRAEYGVAAHWKYKEERPAAAGAAGTAPATWPGCASSWTGSGRRPTRPSSSSRSASTSGRPRSTCSPRAARSSRCRRAPRRWTSRTPSTPRSATAPSGPGSTAAWSRWRARWTTATRSRSSPPRRQDAGPSRDWLQFVKSARARNKIRHWFSKERREAATETGQGPRSRGPCASRACRCSAWPPATRCWPSPPNCTTRTCPRCTRRSARGTSARSRWPRKLVQSAGGMAGAQEDLAEATLPTRPPRPRPIGDSGVVVEGAADVWARLSKCCTPVPGDEITGFVTRGHGVSVHRADCLNLRHLLDSQPERLVAVRWSPTEDSLFLVAIQVEALDRTGLLSDVTRTISDQHVNILSASVTTTRDRVAVSRFTFEMGDPKHLGHVLRAVRAIDGVYDVYRITS